MRRILAAFILVAPVIAPAFAHAADTNAQCSALLDQGCACAVPLESLDGNVFGTLEPISGDVLLTRTTGSQTAISIENVSVGDSVTVLENGNALLNAGPTCQLQLPAQSSLVVREVEGCACASLVEVQRVASVPATEATGSGRGVLAAAVALAVAGGAAAILLSNGDDDGDSVSP